MHARKTAKKSINYFAISAIIMLFIFPAVCRAQQPLKDIGISFILPEFVNASNYTKFIRVTNNDDITGVNDNLSVFISMVLHNKNGSTESEWNATKNINSYSESGFGTLMIENGAYVFCAEVFALNFEDYNISNNRLCENISSLPPGNYSEIPDNGSSAPEIPAGNQTESGENDPFANLSDCNFTFCNESQIVNITADNLSDNVSGTLPEINQTPANETNNTSADTTEEYSACTCILDIKTSKELFIEGEKIEFRILDCWNSSKYMYPIEYWVEDREGIVKQILNTTIRTTKSYTPSINAVEKYFLVKSRIQGCPNVSEKLVVFTGVLQEEEISENIQETFLELSDISYSPSDGTVYVRVKGYKGDSTKTLVSVWIENSGKKLSGTTKFYVNSKNSFFDFKIPVFVNEGEQGAVMVVAEGLGEREENKIHISPKENEPDEKNLGIINENSPDRGKITSFYTLKKYLDENITVYISVEDPLEKSLKILWENETVLLKNISAKNAVNISPKCANVTVFSELYFKDNLIDSSGLALNLSLRNESENKKEYAGENRALPLAESAFRSVNISESNGGASNEITGEIISVRPSGKGVAFVFVATIVCFFLFSRKAKLFFIKKLKSAWVWLRFLFRRKNKII